MYIYPNREYMPTRRVIIMAWLDLAFAAQATKEGTPVEKVLQRGSPATTLIVWFWLDKRHERT